jgi:hypothetical protein
MSQFVKTKRQANFKDFKRFGVFKGLIEQTKKTLYSTRSCVNWALTKYLAIKSLVGIVWEADFKLTCDGRTCCCHGNGARKKDDAYC